MQNPTTTILPKTIAMTPTLRFSFFRTIADAGKDWALAEPVHDAFLQKDYLQAIENTPPEGMRFGYLVFYKNDRPIGVAYCQIKYFKGDDNIQELENSQKDPCFFSGMTQWFKRWVAGRVAADILICGNLLLTGDHGYYFDYQQITPKDACVLLEESLVAVLGEMERSGVKMPVILIKDLPMENKGHGQALKDMGFTEFKIQPNMVLDLEWENQDAYLGAMTTKYRTRAKRAFKKLKDIEKKELTLEDMERESDRMYALYHEIAKNAGFNMVDLNKSYLCGLKRDLPDRFRCFGYFKGDQLLAFFTTINNGKELEAHFLGYDKSLNHDLQLYLNILYDITQLGINDHCHRVVFARTALEIKSSVGAVATDLYCYLRHQNGLYNKFAGTLLDYLTPVETWLPRHPFKGGEEGEKDD